MTKIKTIRFALITLCAPLLAHDMWIEPTAFFPQTGQMVAIKLRVGQEVIGDPIPRSTALINQFIVVDAEGRKPVVGREGFDPAGYIRATSSGLNVVGYFSNASSVELAPEKFSAYLKEEGLDSILALRAKNKQTNLKVNEQFFRCAKSLVLLGPPTQAQADKTLGFILELVAERNPYTLRIGEELPLRLTYENRPLAGALVVAMNRLNPADKQTARTDKDGRVRMKLASTGMWMIKAVHMVPGAANSGADYASYWASLTFETKAAYTQRN